MIKVGITGGIGSGKSLICKVFSMLGVPVYNADDRARYLMSHNAEIRKDLISVFGEEIYSGEELNRSRLADYIFVDPGLLARVNKIVHPRVGDDFVHWCNSHSGVPFTIQESAILFESNAFQLFDYVILVTAPQEIRIQRVLNRPDTDREKILRIMKNQLPEDEKIARSHFVLKNDGTTLILPRILSIYTELSNKLSNRQE
jgi:dephospho-CoA kinase